MQWRLSPRAKMATPKSNRQQSLDSYVDNRAYEATRRGTRAGPRLRPTPSLFRRPGSNRQVASSRSDHGMISRADTLLQLPRSTSCLPLRSSVSRAAPGQSRRHAVRSWLGPLSRGPVHPERKLPPSGISILWLRYKNEWRSRQYYEDSREGFPSVPEVGRPLDRDNLRERSFRSSK